MKTEDLINKYVETHRDIDASEIRRKTKQRKTGSMKPLQKV